MDNLRLGDIVGGVPDVDHFAGLDIAGLCLLGTPVHGLCWE